MKENDTCSHGLTGQPLNVGMKCIWDITFYQGHVLLTDIQCRASQKVDSPPALLSLPTSVAALFPHPPSLQDVGRFEVQNDEDSKGKSAAKIMHYERRPTCHPDPTCFVSLIDPSPILVLASLS